MIIVLIGSILQAHQANKRANATINLTIGPKPKATTALPDASELIPTSPSIKQESPAKQAAESTPKQAAIKPPATVQTYK
jgi:hypothetical protein